MKKSAQQLNKEIKTVLRSRSIRHSAKRKARSPHQLRTDRLMALRGIMEDVYGDSAWRDTDLEKLESWISVDDDLSEREWLDAAKNQLVNQSVLAEHAGAALPAVYQWNDAFISTYRMNRDMGMSVAEAVDSARQNAFDTVSLTSAEAALIRDDPKLYKNTY